MCVVRLKDSMCSKYVSTFLNSDIAQKMYDTMKKEVARANLSLENISDIMIPVPDVVDQEKIVSQIEELEKQIAVAQSIIDNSKLEKQKILDKYLK